MIGLIERVLVAPAEMEERAGLLAARGLKVPGGEDLVFGFFEDERLVATGALVGDTLQGIAVDPGAEGEGIAAKVITSLIKIAVGRGMSRVFLYTSPDDADRFESLGFSLLGSARVKRTGLAAALLEWGPDDIQKWKESIAAYTAGGPDGAGVTVVNCNPFTLGHLSLIKRAAALVPRLYVMVVEEDRSLFPFHVRLKLVAEGTAAIPNVTVLPGGPYVISSATFPTYFTRIEAEDEKAFSELYAALDAEIFGRHIAPALKASHRFVGTEPYCAVTSVYNKIMMDLLPGGGRDRPPVQVHELPRLELEGTAVSASLVRSLIRSGKMMDVRPLVPESTWRWLNSPEADSVIKKIMNTDSRH